MQPYITLVVELVDTVDLESIFLKVQIFSKVKKLIFFILQVFVKSFNLISFKNDSFNIYKLFFEKNWYFVFYYKF